MNLIRRDFDNINSEISKYLDEVIDKARKKLRATEHTSNQHTIPRFILKHIAAQDPKNADKEKGLHLQEYKIQYDFDKKILGEWVKLKKLTSLKEYSSIDDIYESPFLGEDNLLESILSVIETDAARMIRARIREDYDITYPKDVNPFYFNSQSVYKISKVRMRIMLSALFGVQLLRAKDRAVGLGIIKEKYNLRNIDFPTNIIDLLMKNTFDTYYRQWVWVRVPNSEVILSELGQMTFLNCSGHAAGIMPLSRRDYVYFSDESFSHLFKDDKIVYSDSHVFNDLVLSSIFKDITKYSKTLDDGKMEIKIALNTNASQESLKFRKSKICCLSHALKEVTESLKNQIFLANDIHLKS